VQISGEVKPSRAERFCGKSGMAPQQNQRNNKHTISTHKITFPRSGWFRAHGELLAPEKIGFTYSGAADVQGNPLRYLGAAKL